MDDPCASQGALTGASLAFERQRAAMAVTITTPPEKAVLLVLAIMANEDGAAWPPISGPTGIAGRASLSRRATQEALRGLEAKGLVERDERPGRGAVYTLRVEVRATRACAPSAHVQEARTDIDGGCAPPAPKQPRTPNRRKETTSLPSTRARTTSGLPTPSALDLPPLPAGASEQQWADYVEMRVAMSRADKKRPWTPTVARKAIEKLHALAADGSDPGAVLDQSVLNTWQGLFPVKDDRNGRPDRTRPDAVAGPRRGYGADMLAAAHARPADDPEGDPRDSGRAEGEVPAWLRRRP